MGNVNSQFLISMLIIALGYFSKRVKLIGEKDGEGLSKVIFNFTLPALIINTFSTMKVDFSLGVMTAAALCYGVLMSFLAVILFRKRDRFHRGMLSMLLPSHNIGLFAFPIIEGIWGEKAIKYLAMFDMGNALIVFGVCYCIAGYFSPAEGSIDMREMLRKMVRSVPLLSYVITLTVNLLGFHFPGPILEISKVLSKANMPLSLLLLGVYLGFSLEAGYWKNLVKVLAVRYAAGITVGLILFYLLPFQPMMRYTLLIMLILPVGLSVIPYSVQFKYDPKFVGTLVNINNVVSFALMWAIFSIAGL